MAINDVFIGRQPVLDRHQRIFGYELLFRGGQTNGANVLDNVQATASVMVNTLNNIGVRRLIGKHNGFVNVDEEILRSGLVELLPREQSVLEILETVKLTSDVIGQCMKLRNDGYRFALDDFVYQEAMVPIFDVVEYIKIDILATSRTDIEELIKRLRKYHFTLLAEKVETKEDFDYLRDLGFNLFQGYFFAKPSVITAKSVSPSHAVLIELLRLLSREAELHHIEQLFRRNPELHIKLLKFLNSAAFYTVQSVTSILQSIMLLGYRTLQKWVTLLLFAGTGYDVETNPLFERAAMRGRMGELLAKRITGSEADADRAFMCGVLSLIDVLFQIPIEQALTELSLDQDIKDALIQRKGLLGSLLTILENLELENLVEINGSLGGYGLTLEDLFAIERTATIEYENYQE